MNCSIEGLGLVFRIVAFHLKWRAEAGYPFTQDDVLYSLRLHLAHSPASQQARWN